MGHHEGRLTLLLEPPYQVADVVYPHRVEAGGRFVEEDVIRFRGERPGDGDPLLHPSRQLGGVVIDGILKTDEAELLDDDPLDFRFG